MEDWVAMARRVGRKETEASPNELEDCLRLVMARLEKPAALSVFIVFVFISNCSKLNFNLDFEVAGLRGLVTSLSRFQYIN